MIAHLNIDSVQNKLDDLKLLKRELKSQVIFLSETKIDSSYKDDQFSMRGYNMFRKDRKKGGGGLMAFISTNIASKKVSAPAIVYALRAESVVRMTERGHVLASHGG